MFKFTHNPFEDHGADFPVGAGFPAEERFQYYPNELARRDWNEQINHFENASPPFSGTSPYLGNIEQRGSNSTFWLMMIALFSIIGWYFYAIYKEDIKEAIKRMKNTTKEKLLS